MVGRERNRRQAVLRTVVEDQIGESFDGNDARPREFFEYGRTYLFGVNYRY